MSKRRLILWLTVMMMLAPIMVWANHSFTDFINTPNFNYQVRYTNDNPYVPPPGPTADKNYLPDAQAQAMANALNNNATPSPGNPNGYHTGYTSLGFRAPDFAGASPRTVDVYDCAPHGGCDSGNAPADRINMPAPIYIQASEPCIRLVIGHELFHHVQYAYITFGKWSAWGRMPVEGTARMMQDKIYSDLDANAGCITYRGQVNSYLGSPNQTIWNASYSSALFWNYATEQLGTTSGEPNIGVDFVERFWENARNNNSSPDTPANWRRTIRDFDVNETLENLFHDFTIANVAKDLDVSALDDALKYRYVDENDGSSGSYNQVARRWSGNVPPQRGPTADSVVRWGARYYEANIGPDCQGVVGFHSEGDRAAYSLLAITGTDDVQRLYKSVTDTFSRTLIQRSGADRYTRLIAVVTGLDDPANFTYTFACGQVDMVILEPTASNKAYVGEPADPDPFLIRLRVYGPAALGATSVRGLDPTDFTVYVGAEDPANNAPVLSAAYVQGEYWLVAQAPAKASTGTYPLLVKLGDLASDTKSGVVVYEKRILDQVLVIDRSGSMLSPAASPKLDAAKNAASLFVDAARSDDKLGVVSFGGDNVEPNDDANLEWQLKDVTDANRTSAKNAINALSTMPNVLTSIGDGIKKGKDEFPIRGSALGEDWIVLLSDGMENEALFWTNVKASVQAAGVKVQAIALGPYADQALMQAIATDTGGRYYYVDVAPGTLASQSALASSDLPNRLADAYAISTETIRGHDRIYETRGSVSAGSGKQHTIILKEGGVEDGLFSINWNDPANDIDVRIIRPDGSPVQDGVAGARVFKTKTHYVAQVGAMMPGEWRVEIQGVSGATNYMLILSGKNRQGARMRLWFGQFHENNALRQQNGVFLRGLPMPILVALFDDKGPIRGAEVTAAIEHPDGEVLKLPLFDDGNHGDGLADDGVYGNEYTRTTAYSQTGLPDDPDRVPPQRGSYNVVAVAEGEDHRGNPFTRIRKGAFQIFEGYDDQKSPDLDEDGMPNRYEALHPCLDPLRYEPNEDPDRDGIPNVDEWKLGANPCDPDTDRGGENDRSELGRGANPFDPRDDMLPRPIDVEVIDWVPDHMPRLKLLPNSNLIRYPANAAYRMMRLYRAPDPNGPFTLVDEFPPDDTALHRDEGLVNGRTYYYYIEALDENGRVSAPSPIFSGTPKADPIPPIGRVVIDLDRYLTASLRVPLHLGVDDDDVVEMLIANNPRFEGAKWRPFEEEIEWELEPSMTVQNIAVQDAAQTNAEYATVYVKFRDEAGNESQVYQDDILIVRPQSVGGLKGRVLLADKKSPAGVFVRLLNYLLAPPEFADEEGQVFFSPLPSDRYDIRFEHPGYAPRTLEGVPVKEGEITDFGEVVLEPAVYNYLPIIFR
ncbi:MAG: VWA domain-containing protein [Chloroflexi bacterium]|nr:VWA domain-containing protein [Chloroflexota bacterium]